MKTRKSLVRVISMMLILVLMLGGMPVVALDNTAAPSTTAPADETAGTVTEAVLPAPAEENLLGPGELDHAALQTAVLAPTDIPDALPAGTVEAKGHVNRLYAQEEGLSHLLFQNRDGGKTAYFYGKPVKYVAADGSVRDKSKTLIAVDKTYDALGYDFGVEDNSFRQYYAQNPAVGVLVELAGGSIRILPHATGSLMVPRGQKVENTFVYNNIFGNTTALVYTPLLSGMKEDIILRSFAGVSDFTFTYRTSGLSLVEIDGTYAFVDESGLPQATLGAILISDAEGKTATGSLTVTATAVTGVYTVTVHADRDILTDPDTVYPVTVDPTVTIPETVIEGAAILDYGLYSSTVIPSDADLYNYLGNTNSGGTVGRIIYKFTPFIKNAMQYSNYTSINGYQISAADLLLCGAEVDGGPGTFATAYPLTMSWSSSSNAFSSTPLFNSCKNGTPTERGSIGFDYIFSYISITDIIKAWANYNDADTTQPNPANGLVLVDDNELGTGYAKRVYAVEGPYEDVFLYVDYSNTVAGKCYLNNDATGRMLQRSGSAGSVGYYSTSNYANQQWIIEYIGSGHHVIRLQSNPSLYLTASGSSLTLGTSSSDARAQWTISGNVRGYIFTNIYTNTVLCNDGSSLSLVSPRSSSASNYANTTWLFTPSDGFVMLEDFSLTGETFIAPGSTTQVLIDDRTPEHAWLQNPKCYAWSTSNASFTFPSVGYVAAPATGGYTTITVTYKPAQITKTIYIESRTLDDGIYKFKNMGSSYFMDVLDNATNAGAFVNQYTIHGGAQQQWRIEMLENGAYTIQSCSTDLYMAVQGASTAQANIVLIEEDDIEDNAKWFISYTEHGYLSIKPAHIASGTYALSSPKFPAVLNPFNEELINNVCDHSDEDLYDEWEAQKMEFELTVDVYFDNAYAIRVGLSSNNNARRQLKDKCAIAAEFFKENFNLNIHFNIPQLYQSLTDQCKLLNYSEISVSTIDLECPLSHGNDANGDRIDCTAWSTAFEHFIANTPETSDIRILFTGHMLYNENGEAASRSFSSGTSNGISMQIGTTAQYINLTDTLIHEISHQIAAVDHYHDSTDFDESEDDETPIEERICHNSTYGCSVCAPEGEKRPSGCIMACEYSTSDGVIYCEECYAEIFLYLYNHYRVVV